MSIREALVRGGGESVLSPDFDDPQDESVGSVWWVKYNEAYLVRHHLEVEVDVKPEFL